MSFTGYSHTLFENKGSCTFVLCNFAENTGDYLIENKGGKCKFINCTITGNKNDDLIKNKGGSLSIINSTIMNNKCRMNNDKGSLYLFNSKVDSKTCIHNYQTANCEIINCTGADNVEFEEPGGLADWKKGLIFGGIGIAVAAISFCVGNVFASMANTITGYILAYISSFIVGAGVGATGGFIADAIIGHYTHDHNSRIYYMISFATIGVTAAMMGASTAASSKSLSSENTPTLTEEVNVGNIKYNVKHKTAFKISREFNGSLIIKNGANQEIVIISAPGYIDPPLPAPGPQFTIGCEYLPQIVNIDV